MKQFYRLTADCSGCVVVQAYGIRFAILLLSSPLTSPGTEYLPIIVNITLPSDYFCVRCLRFHRLLYFTPDAYSHPLSKSFGKKALFVIQPTGVLAARQSYSQKCEGTASIFSVTAIEIRINHILFQIERPDGNNVASLLNCFSYYYYFFKRCLYRLQMRKSTNFTLICGKTLQS